MIRKAEKKDCKAMMELIHELAIFEKAGDEVVLTLDQFIEDGFGDNAIWGAFVAEIDGGIVGMSLYYDRYSTWKGRRLYLEDLVVNEKMRGKKIGKQLFDATLEHGKTNGYSGMVFQVLNWNEKAIEFYKKYPAKFDDEWINVSVEIKEILKFHQKKTSQEKCR